MRSKCSRRVPNPKSRMFLNGWHAASITISSRRPRLRYFQKSSQLELSSLLEASANLAIATSAGDLKFTSASRLARSFDVDPSNSFLEEAAEGNTSNIPIKLSGLAASA